MQSNDPEGYIPPYKMMNDTEKELWLYAYYRLTNRDSWYTKRCFGILYGNLSIDF